MIPQGGSDATVVAFTVGTAVLAALQWLHDLRYHIDVSGWIVALTPWLSLIHVNGRLHHAALENLAAPSCGQT